MPPSCRCTNALSRARPCASLGDWGICRCRAPPLCATAAPCCSSSMPSSSCAAAAPLLRRAGCRRRRHAVPQALARGRLRPLKAVATTAAPAARSASSSSSSSLLLPSPALAAERVSCAPAGGYSERCRTSLAQLTNLGMACATHGGRLLKKDGSCRASMSLHSGQTGPLLHAHMSREAGNAGQRGQKVAQHYAHNNHTAAMPLPHFALQ